MLKRWFELPLDKFEIAVKEGDVVEDEKARSEKEADQKRNAIVCIRFELWGSNTLNWD